MGDGRRDSGFSEEALRGLDDLERRLPPPGVVASCPPAPRREPAGAGVGAERGRITGATANDCASASSPAVTRRCRNTSCSNWCCSTPSRAST